MEMPFWCPACGERIPDKTIASYVGKRANAKRKTHAGPKLDPKVARCGCGQMTLKRAKARGKSAKEHKPGCEFYSGRAK